MNYKLLTDADSLLYIVGYRHKETLDIERMYFDFAKEISKIETALWIREGYSKGDTLETELIFTQGNNFRYEVYPQYKFNRKEKTALDEIVKKLKQLIIDRLDFAYSTPNVEADDVVISKAKQHKDKSTKVFIVAIDKDVINASSVPCFNYKKNEWAEKKTSQQIEEWYLFQAIMGDSGDGIPGIKGVGKVGAKKIVDDLKAGRLSKEGYVMKFGSTEECELMNRLVRMDQWDPNTKEIKLWTLNDWCLISQIEIEQEMF